ncbi:MAG: DUF4902 domain-containing protein [Candidatus Saccharibacteria bacterium]|nr:DUF4902 domain-containing protein [Moraxellaceae bacterium]
MNKGNLVTHSSVLQEKRERVMTLSDDGFIRMDFKHLMETSLSHLISVNEETRFTAPYTHIFGFTEWVSVITPVISVGWDWKLSHDDQFIKIVRVGQPRSNLMFTDYMQCDIGLNNTEELIIQKIDMIAWEMIIKDQIFKPNSRSGMVLSHS